MSRSESRKAFAEVFSHEARRFTTWADGSTSSNALTAPLALRRVVALYAAALELPQPWSRGVSTDDEPEPDVFADRVQRLRVRAAAVPLQHYGEIFSPLVTTPNDPVVGDLADDLVVIYRDVVLGLHLHDLDRVDDALWQWGFNFQLRWGRHASSAIRALHCYLAQEDPSGLSIEA